MILIIMPTYDYTCESCGHSLECRQKITEEPLKNCPECNKDALVRGFGGGSAHFRFMGNGFYITDYKKGGCGCSESHTCSSKKSEN